MNMSEGNLEELLTFCYLQTQESLMLTIPNGSVIFFFKSHCHCV